MGRADLDKARKAYKREMGQEVFRDSPLDDYLNFVRSNLGEEGPETADALIVDIHDTFTSEAGLRVLKLMEKAVLHAPQPLGSPDSALREMNAIRNFVLNLRRIVAHGR
ncbi:MAG: hypothetical protein JXQ91_07690 [Vannielia sp.]|uniref:hypothetical protein n=1 Tax=Vannielia sp. TaxID=2813045 RepID=UPI003B8DD40D